MGDVARVSFFKDNYSAMREEEINRKRETNASELMYMMLIWAKRNGMSAEDLVHTIGFLNIKLAKVGIDKVEEGMDSLKVDVRV